MKSSAHLTLILAALLCLSLLSACARPMASSGTDSSPLLPPVRQITLLPVLFSDRAQDRYVEHRTSEEILWQARRVLEYKGYQVVPMDDPSLHSFITPFDPEHTSPEALAAMGPESSDAVMLIRIDNFLDAEIYGGNDTDGGFSGGSGSLDIYATAQLVLRRENRLIWQGKGFGSDGDSGGSPIGLLEIGAARALVDNLFAPLPAASAKTP